MPDPLLAVVYVLAFIAVVLLVQTTTGMILNASDRVEQVNRRLSMLRAGKTQEEVFTTLVRKAKPSHLDALRLSKLREVLANYSRQAGVLMSPERLVLVTLAVAAALWLAALAIAQRGDAGGGSPFTHASTSFIGALAIAVTSTWLWLRHMRLKRLRRIEEQLPGALDIVNRALRAGHPVVSAIKLASEELGDPLGSELGLAVDETTYGVEFEQALLNFAERTGSADAHFFAVSVSVQAETGGNLAEILEGLAKVIRGRQTLSRRIKSLSSEGRASAVLISVMPIFVISVRLMVNPTVYADKFSDPIFWPVVALTATMYGFGWLMVRRIINFKY